jgi:AbrB family looped-hinge helix DNA binding protein
MKPESPVEAAGIHQRAPMAGIGEVLPGGGEADERHERIDPAGWLPMRSEPIWPIAAMAAGPDCQGMKLRPRKTLTREIGLLLRQSFRLTLRLTRIKEQLMSTATITSKGQLTLPKAVRDALDLHPGDRVNFVRMEDGRYAVLPANLPVMALKGIIAGPAAPVSLESMDRAIASGASDA